MSSKPCSAWFALFAVFYAFKAFADAPTATPSFDRPGIAFSTATLPAGSLEWEQGFPDVEYDSQRGEHSTLYSADTNIRIGITDAIEIQIAGAPFNLERSRSDGTSNTKHGPGDTRLGLKFALPAPRSDFSWAVLGSVSFPTGDAPFTANYHQYDLGTTLSLDLSDAVSASFYVDALRENGATLWGVSPSLSFDFNDRLAAFVELGASFGDGDGDGSRAAGGGLTWMLTPAIQLDLSADFGLNEKAPDIVGGLGISVFLK